MKYIILSAIMILVLSSCEKVINVDLNAADKKYVIEAVVTDEAGMAKVMISQTKNFDEDNNFPPVSGATVTVSETGGATTTFNETSPGTYVASALAGTSGKTYNLSVAVGGKTFTAVSTMPQKVNPDSIFVTDELLVSEVRKIVNVKYQEPPGRGNNYRYVQYINTHKTKQLMITNDDYTDGRTVIDKLFYFPDDNEDSLKIKSGDHVKIEMLCIDANVYKYWFSLDRSSTGTSGQATPANPVTNMQGGALGYFSAQTYQSKSLVVP